MCTDPSERLEPDEFSRWIYGGTPPVGYDDAPAPPPNPPSSKGIPMQTSSTFPPYAKLLAAGAAAIVLAACGRDDQTVGQRIDSAVATTESKAAEVKSDIKQEAAEAKAATQAAADSVASAVDDAAITASVNAELAKDQQLSALKIDVDTANGRVQLKGSAPDADSKDRATKLAQAVKGVVSVDNQLMIGS